jgi:hypothetical protein
MRARVLASALAVLSLVTVALLAGSVRLERRELSALESASAWQHSVTRVLLPVALWSVANGDLLARQQAGRDRILARMDAHLAQIDDAPLPADLIRSILAAHLTLETGCVLRVLALNIPQVGGHCGEERDTLERNLVLLLGEDRGQRLAGRFLRDISVELEGDLDGQVSAEPALQTHFPLGEASPRGE